MTQHTDIEEFSTEGWPVLSQDLLGKVSRNKEYDDNTEVFYSSGGSKQIGFSPDDFNNFVDSLVGIYTELGLSEDHTVMTWSAPKGAGHMSQPGYKKPPERMGAEVINESKEDFMDYRDRWGEVNAIISMPRMVKSIGEKIEADPEFGNLQEEFPEIELSLNAGDVASDSLRDWVEEKYDLEMRNFWAATEMGGAAFEVEPGVYKPKNPNHILEVLDENAEVEEGTGKVSEEDVYRLDELEEDEQVTGPMLVTDLREELPIVRYRLGDVWTVWGTDDGPRMSFEGREDNVILFSGANLYPEEVDSAVRDLYDQDWKLVVSEEDDYVSLDFFFPEEDLDDKQLAESLRSYNKTMDDWYNAGAMDNIHGQTYESWQELEETLEDNYDLPRDDDGDIELLNDIRQPPKTPKMKRVAFDSSYTAG